MYVRQDAYANSVPHNGKITRAERIEQANSLTESKKTDDDSDTDESEGSTEAQISLLEIPMPPIPEGSEYLIGFLHNAGTATATGMGLVGLTWCELHAWVKCMNLEGIVTPRDLKMIHTLSRAYANECSMATQKDAKPPYEEKIDEEVMEVKRAIISDSIEAQMAALMAQNVRK